MIEWFMLVVVMKGWRNLNGNQKLCTVAEFVEVGTPLQYKVIFILFLKNLSIRINILFLYS